jgi:hypothetical protein
MANLKVTGGVLILAGLLSLVAQVFVTFLFFLRSLHNFCIVRFLSSRLPAAFTLTKKDMEQEFGQDVYFLLPEQLE